jgi:hypothetical protein
MTQIMGGALIAAIDSLAAATKYAADKHGWKLEFNEEDIRASANSVFIQFWKDRETRAPGIRRQRRSASTAAPNGSNSAGGAPRRFGTRDNALAEPGRVLYRLLRSLLV